jgi:hypothetical protein
VAGEESFDKRTAQIKSARAKARKEAVSYEELLGKVDGYMPERAQREHLAEAFVTNFRNAAHCGVDAEPAYNLQIATERRFTEDGPIQDLLALFQHEIVSPPRSPEGLPLYLAAIGQRIIDQAPDFDLKRAEIRTQIHDMSCSSLHFHISLWGMRDNTWSNLLERDSFPDEKGKKKRDSTALSQLALSIGFSINQFLRDHVYLFAPTDEAYVRFSDSQFVGTSHIGFSRRKERFNMGSAMYRGAGRETFRKEDAHGQPDTGPLRIELRLCDVGAIGHPNKRAYPEQLAAPYEITEALLQMIRRGVSSWGENRRIAAIEARPLEPMTEESLYQQHYPLPSTREEAWGRLQQAVKSEGGAYITSKRLKEIEARSARHRTINTLDNKPRLERGQNVDRSSMIKLHEHDFKRSS